MSSRFTAGSVSFLLWAALMVPAVGWVTVAAADQGPSEKEEEPAPRHRISFGAQWFDGSVTLGSVERPPIQNPYDSRSSDEFVELTPHLVLP